MQLPITVFLTEPAVTRSRIARSLSLAVVERPTVGRGMQGGNPVPQTILEKLFRLLETAVSSADGQELRARIKQRQRSAKQWQPIPRDEEARPPG
jgi:hypothetical protein